MDLIAREQEWPEVIPDQRSIGLSKIIKTRLLSSLRARLLVVLMALTVLPVLLIGGLAYRHARQTIEDRLIAHLTSVADLKKEQINNWLDERSADARLLADNFLNQEHLSEILAPEVPPESRAFYASFLTDNLQSLQNARVGYNEIFIVDPAGRVLLSTDEDSVGEDRYSSPAVRALLGGGQLNIIEDIHISPYSGEIEMAFGHLMMAVDLETLEVLPEVAGAVVIRVSMEETIYPLIQAWPGMGATGETLLVRREAGNTLFLNPLRFNQGAALRLTVPGDSIHARPAHLATAGLEGISQTTDYRAVPVLAAYRYIPEVNWGFVAKEDLSEAFNPIHELTQAWIGITLLGLAMAIGAALLFTRSLTRPVDRLVEASRAVAAGEYEVMLEVGGEDEFAELTSAFNHMTEAVRQSYAELQTHGEELEALYTFSQTLLGTLDIDFALESAVIQANAGTNTAGGAVLLVDEATGEIQARVAVNLPDELLGMSFPVNNQTAPGYALLERRPIYTEDLLSENEFDVPPLIRHLGIRSILAVPMLVGDRAVGAIVLDSYEKRSFSQDEIRVAQSIANQTAIALERAHLFRHLGYSYDRTLDALVAALDARDNETEGHSMRVVAYTLAIAKKINFPEADLPNLRRGALLHDIGKIAIPDAILHKPGPLTDEEWAIMRQHPEWGEKILSGIEFLSAAARLVLSHHERWDGSGYPRGMARSEIPLAARIFSVADTFDAITSDRPYRAARPYEVARQEIIAGSATQFDPEIVQAFLDIPESEWDVLRSGVARRQHRIEPLPLWIDPQLLLPTRPKFEALNRLVAALSEKHDLDEVLQAAAMTSAQIFEANASAVYLLDPATQMLKLESDYGLTRTFKRTYAAARYTSQPDPGLLGNQRRRIFTEIPLAGAFQALGISGTRAGPDNYICVPITFRGKLIGLLLVFSRRGRLFREDLEIFYQVVGERIGSALHNAQIIAELTEQSIRDSLTGALNRRYLAQYLPSELARSARYGHPATLILLDIDQFKKFNDSHGHLAGDKALQSLARLLSENLRASDVVARYGGEEFLIMLPETDSEQGLAAAQKLLQLVQNRFDREKALTVSMGLATWLPDAETPTVAVENLLQTADEALYAAKRAGGNCVRAGLQKWTQAPFRSERMPG